MNSEKPGAVTRAEWVLWAWTAWTLMLGLYRTWMSGIDKTLTDQLQGIVSIPPGALQEVMSAGYVLMAVSMAWVIAKIGGGKRWARGSLLLSFVVEALWVMNQPGPLDYLSDIPDFVLQIYALTLLYARPGRDWFASPASR
ncbi:MAG: hypothetical protein ACYCZX_13535 [Rhodospirillaceae bacterium]